MAGAVNDTSHHAPYLREELAQLADLATHSGKIFNWISTIPD
jgi:hypothetical protein